MEPSPADPAVVPPTAPLHAPPFRLKESRAKLRRAKEHLETLREEIEALTRANVYRVAVNRLRPDFYEFRTKDVPALPAAEWVVISGDGIHNCRCALDYIAWKLAGSNPEDNETQFPIFDTEAGWHKRGKRRIKRMTEAAQAAAS